MRKGEEGYIRATYLLLLDMKNKGQPLRFKIYQDVKPIAYENFSIGDESAQMGKCDKKFDKGPNSGADKENKFILPYVLAKQKGADGGDLGKTQHGNKVQRGCDWKKEDHKVDVNAVSNKTTHVESSNTPLKTRTNVCQGDDLVGARPTPTSDFKQRFEQIKKTYNNPQNLAVHNEGPNKSEQTNLQNVKTKHHYYETPTKLANKCTVGCFMRLLNFDSLWHNVIIVEFQI